MEFQSLQDKQIHRAYSKKKYSAGQICPNWAEDARIWPRSSEERGAVAAFEPASGARLSAAPGDRIGIGRFRPSD
jgi:hypothetical protein